MWTQWLSTSSHINECHLPKCVIYIYICVCVCVCVHVMTYIQRWSNWVVLPLRCGHWRWNLHSCRLRSVWDQLHTISPHSVSSTPKDHRNSGHRHSGTQWHRKKERDRQTDRHWRVRAVWLSLIEWLHLSIHIALSRGLSLTHSLSLSLWRHDRDNNRSLPILSFNIVRSEVRGVKHKYHIISYHRIMLCMLSWDGGWLIRLEI